MLRVVSNNDTTPTRRKQLAWVRAILDLTPISVNKLATTAGVSQSTLAKFLNDPNNEANLSATTVEKLARVASIPPYQTRVPSIPRGFSEGEAEPYNAGDSAGMLEDAVRFMLRNTNTMAAWQLNSRAIEVAGYLPGDVLIVDLNAMPKDGDVVCAQVYGRDGSAETVFRIFDSPYLTAASTQVRRFRPLLVDNDRVVVRGVVMTSLRPRPSLLAS